MVGLVVGLVVVDVGVGVGIDDIVVTLDVVFVVSSAVVFVVVSVDMVLSVPSVAVVGAEAKPEKEVFEWNETNSIFSQI